MAKSKLMIICLILFLNCGAFCQNTARSPEQIRKEMAEIRRNTDWSNDAAASKSQAKIEALSKELMIAGKTQQQQAAGMQVDSVKLNEEAEYKMGLWKQMMAAVDQGESGDILLGKPVRDKIVEAYKDDESPKIKNPYYLQDVTLLCIDMSLSTVQRTIDQMEQYKSIQTLIITGGNQGASVDLEDLLNRARDYPLKNLYIINFRHYVKELPNSIGNFKDLILLAAFNNQLDQLPAETWSMTGLKTLYLDMNPISTLFPGISQLQILETLGIGKTDISDAEISQIKVLLPNCKILLQ
jgi:hypothetical protein